MGRRWIPLLVLAMVGCGKGDFGIVDVTPGSVHTPFAAFHAYGDSITYGLTLSNPASEDYVNLVSLATSLPLANYALPFEMGCDVAPHQIFANTDAPSTTQRNLYSLLVSTNDLGVYGAGSYEAVFNECEQAAIGWLAVPGEQKTLATNASVTATGQTHRETAGNWNALYTDSLGASIAIPLHLNAAGPVYVWHRIADYNFGLFSYAVDGKVLGTASMTTAVNMQTVNGTSSSLALSRIPGISAGDHVLTLTQLGALASDIGLVAVGVPAAATVTSPRVLVGVTPRQLAGGGGKCSVDDSICQAYIADIKANVALFAGDGLDVRLFNDRAYTTGTSHDMNDNYHPNAVGHAEFYQAFLDALTP